MARAATRGVETGSGPSRTGVAVATAICFNPRSIIGLPRHSKALYYSGSLHPLAGSSRERRHRRRLNLSLCVVCVVLPADSQRENDTPLHTAEPSGAERRRTRPGLVGDERPRPKSRDAYAPCCACSRAVSNALPAILSRQLFEFVLVATPINARAHESCTRFSCVPHSVRLELAVPYTRRYTSPQTRV